MMRRALVRVTGEAGGERPPRTRFWLSDHAAVSMDLSCA